MCDLSPSVFHYGFYASVFYLGSLGYLYGTNAWNTYGVRPISKKDIGINLKIRLWMSPSLFDSWLASNVFLVHENGSIIEWDTANWLGVRHFPKKEY